MCNVSSNYFDSGQPDLLSSSFPFFQVLISDDFEGFGYVAQVSGILICFVFTLCAVVVKVCSNDEAHNQYPLVTSFVIASYIFGDG